MALQKGGARRQTQQKTKADKPKKPLKVLAVVLTVILSASKGFYFLCIYSNIRSSKKYRTIYINTAMNTMRHQWLATYFIPADIIEQVRYEYGLEIAKSVGTESQWGKNAGDTTTEPEQPGTNHIDAEIVEPEEPDPEELEQQARDAFLRGVLGAGPRQRRRLRRRASGGDRERLGEVLRQ